MLNKNFLIAGGVVLAIGLAIAIGVTLVDEPLDGNLPEGETTVNGDLLPEFASENDDNIATKKHKSLFFVQQFAI